MRIEKGSIYVGTEPETRVTRSGDKFLTFRASMPNPKDAPQGTARVWYGVSVFDAEVLAALEGIAKGDKLTFQGSLGSNNFTDRENNARTEAKLFINAVLGVEKDQGYGNNAAPQNQGAGGGQKAAMAQVARKNGLAGGPIAPSNLDFGQLGQDPTEDLPF